MSPRRADRRSLAPLRLTPRERQVYRFVLRRSSVPLDRLPEGLGVPSEDLGDTLARLEETGLLRRSTDVVTAVAPDQFLAAFVDQETARLDETGRRLAVLHGMLPALMSENPAEVGVDGAGTAIQVAEYDQVVPLLRSIATSSEGDLLWLRPDQWRVAAGRQIDEWVRELVSAGRASRAIYPARVLEEAPEVVQARADVGEHVRVLASVPARMAVLGTSAVVMHETWQARSGRLVVLRQEAVVAALTLLFDQMWDQALNVPGFGGRAYEAGKDGAQRLLLEQLVRGAKDEQISRALGVSLRTVRRRVADLMDELGADSRFQAGVEAVRRGWV
jgi:DNA-binding CsgD family transcriptional regulator